MKPPLHRYGAVPGAHRRAWPTKIPTPHILRPQLFAGAGANGDLYDCHSMPKELIKKLKNASYICSGLSADVWDLNDGTVLKITKEDAAVKICKYLEKNRIIGLPHVHQTIDGIRHLGFKDEDNWKRGKASTPNYTAIIQTKYDAIDPRNWAKITAEIRHLDLSEEPNRFGRGSDGEAARGQEGQDIAYQMAIVSHKLKKEDPQHPLAKCTVAIATLCHWMRSGMLHPNAGLDIDHPDNWAQDDGGTPIMLDPIYTVRPNPRTARSAWDLTPSQAEQTPSV